MRILYVSDSLGTPIHPRGIFNYSVSLVEMLATLGAEVDLVVEGGAGFGLEGRFGRIEHDAPDAVNALRLAEIHRYFGQSTFAFRWDWRTPRIRFLFARARPWIRIWLGLRERMNYRPNVRVRNAAEQIDFVPAKSRHLQPFRSLVLKRGFYAASMSRANLGLPPVAIDARGYDLAIVDTPHYVSVKGIAPERILAIIHDLIPLRDPTMEAAWRNLFLRKLEATLALKSNLAFVSRSSEQTFRRMFSDHKAPRRFVLYPALRQSLVEATRGGPYDSAPEPLAAPPLKQGKRADAARRLAQPPGYDESLPFFVTAASDEPRKNIATAVGAFASLAGRANLVVVGELDPSRYLSRPTCNVRFAGYVSDAEKFRLFASARAVVFASLAEGFGIPIVEGAAFGAPVICSDIDVFREIAGDDALYFDPRDARSLTAAVENTLANPDTAARRAQALRRRAFSRFSQTAVGADVKDALAELGLCAREKSAFPVYGAAVEGLA